MKRLSGLNKEMESSLNSQSNEINPLRRSNQNAVTLLYIIQFDGRWVGWRGGKEKRLVPLISFNVRRMGR